MPLEELPLPQENDMEFEATTARLGRLPVLGVLITAGLLGVTWGALFWIPSEGMKGTQTEWVLGVVTGILMPALFGLLGLVGIGRRRRSGGAGKWLIGGFAAYAVVFVGLMMSYRDYVADGGIGRMLGLPTPTVWLLLGVWQLPWVLVAAFMFNYERWTLSADDLERFQTLVRRSEAAHAGVGPSEGTGGPGGTRKTGMSET